MNKSIVHEVLNLETVKANIQSPALAGTPTAPTAAIGTSTQQIASTKFVDNAIKNMMGQFKIYVGTSEPNSSSTPPLTAADAGKYLWFCTESGAECIKLYINGGWMIFGCGWK